MESVKTEIGPLTFDRANYDEANDVLYLSVGEPRKAEGEETPEGHVLRYSPGTDRVIGLTLLSPRHFLDRDGALTVSVPERVEMSAEDLAAAFAAVGH